MAPFIWIMVLLVHKQLFFDSKTILQEMVQGKGEENLHYKLIKEEGPDHNKKFTAAAYLGEKKLAQGVGKTKKASEQAAAYEAIMLLKSRE